MLARLDLRGYDGDLAVALARPRPDDGDEDGVGGAVAEILAAVRERGDNAVRDLTERFDGCRIDDLRVHRDEVISALDALDPDLRMALEFARDQILAWHGAQHDRGARHERAGIEVTELVVPVDRAGCYVPGGLASYPSTVLMTAVPARVAGVPEVVLCVPPGPDGRVSTATLAAAALAGVDEVFRIGGAQAIGAMAYGTHTVRPVDVIVGPGNAYVAEAKRRVVGRVGIDTLAGPSELTVVADGTAPPDLMAADLLAQAEHGPGGSAVLVTWDDEVADAVCNALDKLLASAPRAEEAGETLAGGGRVVLVDGPEQAMAVANTIAPEHLQLVCADADLLVPLVRHAGAVFCGPWASAVIGDYVAGVNHVLPTGGTARFAGALCVADFQKRVHVVRVDRAALRRVGPYARLLASAEGLDAHAEAIRLRELRT